MLFNMCYLIFILLCTFVLISYLYVRKKYSYWSDRGIPFDKPDFLYGSLKSVGTTYHISQKLKLIYDRFKDHRPFIGIFTFFTPVVLATDLEFVKTIFVRDFHYFMNRGLYFNEKDDPLSAHLVNIEDQRWKNLRAKLTPTFTSAKMKFMFPTIIAVADEFQKCISNEIKIDSEIELKDIVARFNTDVIGNCAFGLECNSLQDPNARFRQMGKLVFEKPRNNSIKVLFMTQFRELARLLHYKTTRDDVTEFFLNAVKETIDYRKQNNVQKNDFMNLLLQLYKENDAKNIDFDEKNSLTFEEIAAQAFVFFLAGFETSSTTSAYTMYELAQHADIQERARKEIKDILRKNGGKITYESLAEMTYLDQIINESLRKYPPAAAIFRRANSDYRVPGTNHIIKEGISVLIPVYAIHHDPEYYPNPDEFNPDRFTVEEMKKRHPFSFLAFGEGPRICIGLRFAIMQIRIALVTLLLNFEFSTCSRTTKPPLEFKPNNVILLAKGDLWLKVKKI